MSERRGLVWWILVLVLAIQFAAAVFLPKSISWDPSYGMLAAQHFVHGRSPDLLHIAEADRDHLERDKLVQRGYWAPGYQAIPWLLRCGVFDWGFALKATIVLAFVAGIVGWGRYFHGVLGARPEVLWLLLAVACARYTWVFTIVYGGGDLLLWAAAPWVMLVNARAVRRASIGLCLVAGGAAVGIFLLKYSGLFLAAGLGLAWLWLAWTRRMKWSAFLAWVVSAAIVGLVIHLLGFPAKNHAAATVRQLLPAEAVASLGFAATGATDLEAVIARFCDVLHLPITAWQAAWFGVGFLLVFGAVYLIVHRRDSGGTESVGDLGTLGTCAALTDIAALAVVVGMGGNIAAQARLGRIAGLLLLPVFVHALIRARHRFPWLVRATFAGVLFLPAAYGVLAGVPKLVQAWRYRATAVSAEGVACFALDPAVPHAGFFAEVESHLPAADTILFVPQAQLAFPLPRRRCIVFDAALVLPAEKIAQEGWHGRPAGGIALLLPREFEHDPKLAAIQGLFVDVKQWEKVTLREDGKWRLWRGQ